MFDLQGFQNAARADPGAILFLQPRQQNITSRSGPFARWFGRVRLAENHQATGRFLQALGRSYGAEIAREVAAARGLSRLGRVTPLTAGKVANAVRAADDLQARAQQNNQLLADAVRRIEPKGVATESIRTEVEREVKNKRYCGIRAEITARISFEAVADKTKEAIVDAGRNGRHLVGVKEAREIRSQVVEREVATAFGDYFAAKSRALSALDPRLDGSLVFQALVDRFACFDPPLNYDEHTLTPDAAEQLHRKFSNAVATWTIHPERLDDKEALRALAEEAVGRFIDQRQAARSQFDSLGFLSGATRHALLAQVSCDSIPACLVSRAVETSLLIRDDLERLARFPQRVDSEALVDKLSLAMVPAWREPDMDASETNEALAYRWLWRIALSSGSGPEAREILRGMGQEHSPLRSICQAATWYAEEFPETEQHIRAARPAGDDRSFKSKAGDVSKVLNGLWVILQEKTGWEVDGGRVLAADGRPNDATITALRNLGIPFPAPDRLGESNAAVPLADSTLKEIGEAFGRHVRSNCEVDSTGLASNCMDFLTFNQNARVGRLRARFFIDGRELPRDAGADTVSRELTAFCTDEAGNRNDRMLAKVSRMIDPATFDCVYAGCMNPKLPHMAIMNGYPEGVFKGHSYSLWKNDDGAVRLGIVETITPLYWHRFPDAGVQENSQTCSAPTDAILSGNSSVFRTRFVIKFDRERYEPEIGVPDIGYSLIPGAPESPYFIPRSDFTYRDQVPDALDRGQLPTAPPLNPHTH